MSTAPTSFPYPATRDITLGLLVMDTVTGFTGTIIGSAELLTGTKQYFIQPAIAEGAANVVPEDLALDWQRLDVVGVGVSHRYPTAEEPANLIKLGEQAQSLVNGFMGIVVQKSHSLNGCIRFTLESKTASSSDRTKQPLQMSFDYQELVRLNAGVVGKVGSTETGGPSLSRGSMRAAPKISHR